MCLITVIVKFLFFPICKSNFERSHSIPGRFEIQNVRPRDEILGMKSETFVDGRSTCIKMLNEMIDFYSI